MDTLFFKKGLAGETPLSEAITHPRLTRTPAIDHWDAVTPPRKFKDRSPFTRPDTAATGTLHIGDVGRRKALEYAALLTALIFDAAVAFAELEPQLQGVAMSPLWYLTRPDVEGFFVRLQGVPVVFPGHSTLLLEGTHQKLVAHIGPYLADAAELQELIQLRTIVRHRPQLIVLAAHPNLGQVGDVVE